MSKAVVEKFKSVVSPVKYLVIINVACAGLDFVRGILTAMLLGPEMYGISAILSGIYLTVLSLMEFSMSDLAANLYYNAKMQSEEELRRYRASVVQICVLVQAVVTVISIIIGTVITLFTVSLFTEMPVSLMWIITSAAAIGLKYLMSAFDYMKRFAGRFYLTGTWRLIGMSISVTVFLAIMFRERNLDGFFIASLISTSINFAVQAGLTVFMWVRYEKFKLLGRGLWDSIPDFRGKMGFMFSGNMVSYSRLLHLSTDVLFVGYFCGDATTGIYKLARSLTDRLSLFSNAMSQVYLPRCLELLASESKKKFSALVKKLTFSILAATAVIMMGEALVFPYLIKLNVLGFGKYVGVENSLLILTIPFFFRTGLYMWMWPMFVSASKLNWFAVAAFVGDIFQYAVTGILFKFIAPTPVIASIGFTIYYVTAFPICLYILSKKYSGYMPNPLAFLNTERPG